jgi:hypothetical protein
MKRRARAVGVPPGVVGDSAGGKVGWQPRRPGRWDGNPNAAREDITVRWPGRESAGLVVAMKRGNARGAKGPYRARALNKEG